MGRNRVPAPKSGSISRSRGANQSLPAGKFTPSLSHITEGCVVLEVSLSACIPLYLTRPHSDNAVRKLKLRLIGENGDNSDGTLLSGMVSASPTAVVVPLLGDHGFIVDKHLESKYSTEEDRAAAKLDNDTWFGIIDGCFLHRALSELKEDYPSQFEEFVWKVISVRHGLDLSEYKKLAVVENERNKQAYHYETTVSTLLKDLRGIYDTMYKAALKDSRKRPNIPHRDVASAYDGGSHHKNTTVRQAVSVAARLSHETLESIDDIMNSVCPDVILNSSELNSQKLMSTDSVLSHYDCRLYKRFLCISTLRGATLFINALKDGHAKAQNNAIHRLKHWCERNNYRPVPVHILKEQFIAAKLALAEESKFLSFINSSSWPDNMETTRENILRTTVCDRDLHINQGNDTDVLPVIWSSFRRLYPARAKALDSESRGNNCSTNEGMDEPVPDDSIALPPTANGTPESDDSDSNEPTEEELRKMAEDEERREMEKRRAELRMKGDGYLQECGIEIHPMDFNDFLCDKWSGKRRKVDLVLSAVPKDVDDKTLGTLPSFCTAVLKTGSYVVLVVSTAQFITLHTLFTSANFKVFTHPFSILYDTSNLKRRRSNDFPIEHGDIALLAKTQGLHPGGFIPEFTADSSTPECHSAKAFASVSNIKKCANMLMQPKLNSPMFPSERGSELYAHILRLFTPTGAVVIDPFGGPLTTSIACIKTNRKCISMDVKSQSMNYALGRLRIYVTPNAKMEELDSYTDIIDVDKDSAVTSDHSCNESPELARCMKQPSEKRRRLSSGSEGAAELSSSKYLGDADNIDDNEENIIDSNDASQLPSDKEIIEVDEAAKQTTLNGGNEIPFDTPSTTDLAGAKTLLTFRSP